MHEVTDENELRKEFVSSIGGEDQILDCGQSLREYWPKARNKAATAFTLDINRFDGYPDILADICDTQNLQQFRETFDYVSCFSLIEHTYNPFFACQNLFSMCKSGGRIYGSAPFLFPRHSPEDLSYQDYFRFTRDSYALLFPDAKSIDLFPLRGRLATSLNVLSLRYRFIFEKKYESMASLFSRVLSGGTHSLNSSGYGFIISK